MLATAAKLPDDASMFNAGDWIFERKLDGLRCLAVRTGGEVGLWSRNRLSFTRRFPAVVAALAAVAADSFVVDGELVAFDERHGTSFQLLQTGAPASHALVAFDLLYLLGHDIRHLPLADRVTLLRRTVGEGSAHLAVAEPLAGDPGELLDQACAEGWEGLVAKRRSSPYRSGRGPDWRKLKCSARQEFVVGGWTDPAGRRTGFGALLLGYHDPPGAGPAPGGRLRYAGKVGTGFDERTLLDVHRQLLAGAAEVSPFADAPRMKGAHWVAPRLVAEIAFSEWTRDGRLRHPSFLGLRPDKEPGEVIREPPSGRPAGPDSRR